MGKLNDLKKYLLIKIGNAFFGIDIHYVENVVRIQEITRVPKSQPYFKGIMNLRGEIIAVMSLRLKMIASGMFHNTEESFRKLEDDLFTDDSRIVILNIGDIGNVGIIVDEVKGMIVLAEEDVEYQKKEFQDHKNGFVFGTEKYGDDIVSLLNIEAVTGELA